MQKASSRIALTESAYVQSCDGMLRFNVSQTSTLRVFEVLQKAMEENVHRKSRVS